MVARQNVVAARSLAVQQVAIAAHLSAASVEISRSGTPCPPCRTSAAIYPATLHDPYPAALLPPSSPSVEGIFMAVAVLSLLDESRA